MTTGPKPQPVMTRLLKNVQQSGDCLLWTGRLNAYGYGVMTIGSRSDNTKRVVAVHKISWEEENGLVPPDMTLDHLCHTNDLDCPGGPACQHRRCVNTSHLEVVSRGENVRRGRSAWGRRDACTRGHKYTQENTRMRCRVGSENERVCRLCDSMRHRLEATP